MRILSILVVASIIVVSAQAATLKSSILEMNKKVCAALVKGDFKAFEKITRAGVTKNFVYSENGKTESYDEMLKQVKQSMSMGKVTSASSTLVKLDIKGNSATGSTTHTMKMVTKGSDKKNHTMVVTGKSVEVYVKVGNDWKMSKMTWVSSKMTMDGKALDPTKMGAPSTKPNG